MMEKADLTKAYEGSFYTICGAGGELSEWENGVNEALAERGIGKPTAWFQTTGREINQYAAQYGTVTNPFSDDLTIIMFPHEGLDVRKLAIFKLAGGDRWFDDIIDNMVEFEDQDEEE